MAFGVIECQDKGFIYFINLQTHELSIVIHVYVSMIIIRNVVELLNLSLKFDKLLGIGVKCSII